MMDIKKNAKAGNMVRHSSFAMLSDYLCASARLRSSLLRCTVGNGDRHILAGTLRIARPCSVVATLVRSSSYELILERLQDSGQRPRPNTSLRAEVHSDAGTAPSCFAPDADAEE